MHTNSLLVVAYRPIRFYRKYGPIVRDYKFCVAGSFKRVFVIDEIGLWTLRSNNDFDLTRVNLSLNLRWVFQSKRIWMAKRIEAFYEKIIAVQSFDIVVVNHPLVRVRSHVNNTLLDVIDNFSKHVRYSAQEKQRFLDNIKFANDLGYAFAVVTNQAAEELEIEKMQCLDNLPVRVLTSETDNRRSGLICVGFFSQRIDWELLKSIGQLGVQIDLYGRFFDGVDDEIRGCHNISNRGYLPESDKDAVMSNYKAMIIPYRKETEHDGSPAKAYDALSRNLPVVSTVNYRINNTNFHYSADADDIVNVYESIKWDDDAPIPTFGHRFTEIINMFFPL